MTRESIVALGSRLWPGLRVALGLGLLALLLSRVDLRAAWAGVRTAHPGLIGAATCGYALFLLLSNLRWRLMLAAQGMRFGFLRLLKILLVGVFFNNLLPTAIGGDVARVVYTRRAGGAKALSATLMDRGIGFVGLFSLTLLAAGAIYLTTGESILLGFSIAGLLGLLALFGLLFSRRLQPGIERLLFGLRPWGLGERLGRVHQGFTLYRDRPRVLLLGLFLSMAIQIAISGVWWLIDLAHHGGLPLIRYLLYIPIIGVISMIPITPGGLGIREASFYGFSTTQGLAPPQAVSIALLHLLINLGFGVAGGLIFIGLRREKEGIWSTRGKT